MQRRAWEKRAWKRRAWKRRVWERGIWKRIAWRKSLLPGILLALLLLAGCAGKESEATGDPAISIETDRLRGSGVVWSVDEEGMTILTAGHVLEGWQEMSVVFLDGNTVRWRPGEDGFDVELPAGSDLAVLRLSGEALERRVEMEGGAWKEYGAAAASALVDKESFDRLKSGDDIWLAEAGNRQSVAEEPGPGSQGETGENQEQGVAEEPGAGNQDGANGNQKSGFLPATVTEPWIYMEDFGQNMMLGKGSAHSGMSGGGVYDGQGHFIGLLCGGNEEGDLAILPLNIILAQLQ